MPRASADAGGRTFRHKGSNIAPNKIDDAHTLLSERVEGRRQNLLRRPLRAELHRAGLCPAKATQAGWGRCDSTLLGESQLGRSDPKPRLNLNLAMDPTV